MELTHGAAYANLQKESCGIAANTWHTLAVLRGSAVPL